MQTMVPLYGFGGGGGTGAELTVTAPAGCTVTVSKDGKTKTKVAGADGVAVFKGLATGEWTVTITDGEQTAQKTVTITADYATAITFFEATIHITYPEGSTCTATDGVTTLTAPDTSGTWDCVVPNAAVWTVSLDSGFTETVDVTTSGVTYTVNKWHLYNRGDQKTGVTGGFATTGYLWGSGDVSVSPTFGSDCVTLNRPSSKVVYIVTQKIIKIEGFSVLSAVYDCSGTIKYNEDRILIMPESEKSLNSGTYIGAVSLQTGTEVKSNLSINSGINEGKIAFVVANANQTTLYEMWLEV